jgi:hypothetical protein
MGKKRESIEQNIVIEPIAGWVATDGGSSFLVQDI